MIELDWKEVTEIMTNQEIRQGCGLPLTYFSIYVEHILGNGKVRVRPDASLGHGIF